MQRSGKPGLPGAYEVDLIIAEIDRLIEIAEGRIERQHQHVRSMASDFEASIKAIADLDTMTSALERLERERVRIVRWERESIGHPLAGSGSMER